jgi:hypothetical protein
VEASRTGVGAAWLAGWGRVVVGRGRGWWCRRSLCSLAVGAAAVVVWQRGERAVGGGVGRLVSSAGARGAGVSAPNCGACRLGSRIGTPDDTDRSFASESAIQVTWCTTIVDEVTRTPARPASGPNRPPRDAGGRRTRQRDANPLLAPVGEERRWRHHTPPERHARLRCHHGPRQRASARRPLTSTSVHDASTPYPSRAAHPVTRNPRARSAGHTVPCANRRP